MKAKWIGFMFGSLVIVVFMSAYWATGQVTPGATFDPSTIAHVSSVTHVAGRAILQNIVGTTVTVTGTALDVNCTGCSSASNVRVDHVSAVTHVAGRIILTNVAGTAVTVTSGALDVNCTGCAAASVVAVSHISAAVHLAGGVTDNANSAVRVTGVTVFTIMGAVDHVSSQIHVAAFHSSGALRAWQVSTCGTTATVAIATNRARRDLILQNTGTRPIFIGYGTTGHVALTTSNGFMLHAGEGTGGSAAQMPSALGRLELRDYNGPIACVSTDPGQTLNVLELLKS